MIPHFIHSLKDKPTQHLFNPWFERDLENDVTSDAPVIRRRQLSQYLEERLGRAKYLFIAEALGYQGGHFTGIAMTSERILLGHQQDKYGIKPQDVFSGVSPERTSRPELIEKGMTEPTATIMWGSMTDLGIDPYDVVLWNALPWHPYNPEKGFLSNRTPTAEEMSAGLLHLRKFIDLFENVQLVAVGRKCEESMNELGKKFTAVRHPANGGAPKFRKQVRDLML
ncbi:uracil-DNA glycosylase [Rhodohalobacter sp. 8-1]|uniref:uracil-DNA glycosylase n=1 Tax=Rhodohalobacter sp. 8-1 TaxID=3131972 RepID=UPI0030ECA07C